MDERKLKHLELIQGIINRLAGNSFLVKGWSVLLVSALLTLAARRQPDAGAGLLGIPFLPALIFWGLDGYFLWQERLYRVLYNQVRVQPEDSIDFSMGTEQFKTGSEAQTWPQAIFSVTLILFHGAVLVAILAVAYLS